MEAQVRDESFKRIEDASALLVIGSSLHVFSAFRLVKRAHERGIPIAILNLGETRGDSMANLQINCSSSVILQETLALLA